MNLSLLLIPVQALLLFYLPGAVLTAAAARRGWADFRDPAERAFFAGLFSFLLASVTGLLLAYLGVFSTGRLAALSLLYALVLLPALPRPRIRPLRLRFPRRELLALLALFGAAAVLYLRPVPYVFGGWDPGVYANTAAHLAREGTIFPADPLADVLEPGEIERLAWRHSSGYPEKYPGFRYAAPITGRLIPEFYHLFPVWMAVFHSWAGFKGAFLFTPLIALAALAALYFAVRELWGSRAALAAGALLVFNVAQIWQARFPTAELLSQLLLFAGAAAAFKYLKEEEAFWALAAAGAWGLFLLARVSSLLLWAPLAIFFYCRWWPGFRKRDLLFLLPLLFFTGISFLPQIFGDWRYFVNSVANLRLEGSAVRAGALLAGAGVILAAGARLLPRPLRGRLARALSGKPGRGLFLALAAGTGWYAYFLRPYIGHPSADRTNLVEIGWLLGPLLLAAAFLGIFFFIASERSPSAWLFFLVIAAPAAVFTWRQMIHYHYMWAARRFVDAVIPGLIILAVYGLRRISRSGPAGRVLAPAAFLLLLAASIGTSRPLFFHREYRGAHAFVRGLAGRLDSSDLVLVEGRFVDKLPAPLELAYGLKVLPVYNGSDRTGGDISRLIGRGGRVYWLRDRPVPPPVGTGWTLAETLPFHSPLWERRADRLPRRPDPRAPDGNFTVYVFRSEPGR